VKRELWIRDLSVRENLRRIYWIVRNNIRAGDAPWA